MRSLPEGQPAERAFSIAYEFVRAYYNTETDQRGIFYNQDSFFARIDPLDNKEDPNVHGREAIKEKLALVSKDIRVALDSIDSQETANGGVVVVVTGIDTAAGASVRAFTQTFILAQAGEGAYYVRNDVLRYLSKNILASGEVPKTPNASNIAQATQTPKAETAETATTTTADASASAGDAEQKAEPVEEPKAEPEASPEVSEPKAATKPKEKKTRSRKAKKGAAEEKSESSDAKVEAVAEVPTAATQPSDAPLTVSDDEKVTMPPVANSWAGRLGKALSAPLPLQPPIPDPNEDAKGKKGNKTPKVKGQKPVSNKAAKVPEGEAKVDGKPERAERGEKKENGGANRFSDETSIYVANLNKPIKKEEVKQLFEPFGTVEDVHPVLHKNFCFVRFANADSVESVLKAAADKPFVLGDATLAVSKKKAVRDRAPSTDKPTRGAFRGGREGGRGGGRGGATFKANGTAPAAAHAAKSDKPAAATAAADDGFTEATRRNRKRPQN